MANWACSTIRGISILGNSIRGLNFLNWCKVYNALVIPILTYGAPVWYTGVCQAGLVHCLQVAQNDSIQKITGVFRTTPVDPLHNMMGIPPISYVLPKLMHAYSLRLQGLPPGVKVKTVLQTDQCHYWPDYATPPTNLRRASSGLGPSTYHPLDPCTAGSWLHPQLLSAPQPPSSLDTEWLKEFLDTHTHAATRHLFITPTTRDGLPVAISHTHFAH